LLGQGVAHKATGEVANLPELASRTGVERAADELAHTTFFPCLVLHSAHESLFSSATVITAATGINLRRRPDCDVVSIQIPNEYTVLF
jgi:hypothetical protein